MKTTLTVAVRSLVEHVLRSGDLNLDFMGANRALEAIRAHQHVQDSRPDNYLSEVPVSHRMETDRFVLNIGGRIDGVFCHPDTENPESAIIEEIKTKSGSPEYFDSEEFGKHENSMHWGQAKIYAWFYASEHGFSKIGVQLTYYHLDSKKTRIFTRQFEANELKAFFNDVAERYLKWAERIAEWQKTRNESIGALAFPFETYRAGQRMLAEEVYRAIKRRNHLIAQAATGIGKTLATLFPSVKALGLGLGSKIFYLTARTTGRIVAEKSLGELRKGGLRLKSVTLTAKEKVCFNPESACSGEECEYARGYFDRVDEAAEAVFDREAQDRVTILAAARAHTVCPFEFSLELSLWADCVICDYNYAFDPKVYLRRFFADETGDYIFLVDEAHNLVDRSRDMFSAELCKSSFLKLGRALGKALPPVRKNIGKIGAWMRKAKKACEEEGGHTAGKTPPDDLYPLLVAFSRSAEKWLMRNVKTDFRRPLMENYFEVGSFMRTADIYDETYAVCHNAFEKDYRVKLFCVDPSRQMGECLKRCASAVFFSATMTPTTYFMNILGCGDNTAELTVPSPFPVSNLGVFVADRISTYYNDRTETAPQVARAITSLLGAKKGNYLVFFPSYAYMRTIHAIVETEGIPDARLLVQTPSMTETEREAFLEHFTQDNPETLAGFAVMGGIFGEGIDLVGDRLSGAVIVGVGLPGISPERNLVREYFNEHGGSGFEYAYTYPGINRVLQAAGRVIRTETDRGAILLIDRRYGTFRYKCLLPKQWRPVRTFNHGQLQKNLGTFWEKGISNK